PIGYAFFLLRDFNNLGAAHPSSHSALLDFPVSFFSKAVLSEAIYGDSSSGSNRCGHDGQWHSHVFARCGFNVVLCDVDQRFLDRGLGTIAKNLDREVAKNKITAGDKASTLER